jgi:CRISPR-associated protein Csb2
MGLVIEQSFPLGRFHATRWKMGAFGDLYGEWPPSPWRLFRALAARWFQWSRETGEDDRNALLSLLGALSSELPEFYLPIHTGRGEPLKQYLPMQVAWTDASKKAAAYKAPKSSLTEDHYRVVSPNDRVYWVWPELGEIDKVFLEQLLARVIYFGRAESFTCLRTVERVAEAQDYQSVLLSEKRAALAVPILAPDRKNIDRLSMLFQPTEHKNIKGRGIPPGARWYYAILPSPPRIKIIPRQKNRYPENLTHIQFAIGGQVLPSVKYSCLLTERFRKRVLREHCRILTGNTKCDYRELNAQTKSKMGGFTGKDVNGEPLADHSQAYFSVLPDERGNAARLVLWRRAPFSQEEIEALFAAAQFPLLWDSASPKWKIKLLPLPFGMPLSYKLMGTSRRWESVTPFVAPRQRRRFRKNGKERSGETPESIAAKLCRRIYGITPASVNSYAVEEWPYVHMSARERVKKNRRRMSLPSFRLVMEFTQPVSGPIALGDSSHFGLGVFRPL